MGFPKTRNQYTKRANSEKEVTRLYGLTEKDRLALKAELEGTVSDSNDDEEKGAAEDGEEEDAVESA